jgi:hypothetical protein
VTPERGTPGERFGALFSVEARLLSQRATGVERFNHRMGRRDDFGFAQVFPPPGLIARFRYGG